MSETIKPYFYKRLLTLLKHSKNLKLKGKMRWEEERRREREGFDTKAIDCAAARTVSAATAWRREGTSKTVWIGI